MVEKGLGILHVMDPSESVVRRELHVRRASLDSRQEGIIPGPFSGLLNLLSKGSVYKFREFGLLKS